MQTVRGFTLLEAVIYIALLSLLMGGAVVTSYDLVESSQHSSGTTVVQEEGSFVSRKLTWALAGLTTAPTVGGSGCNQTLSVTKTGALNPVQLERNSASSSVEMREGGSGAYSALTTANVSVTCLQFALLAGTPGGVAATTTINGQTFAVTKYLRK
jgi:Tfp pilus assembly protein PilE